MVQLLLIVYRVPMEPTLTRLQSHASTAPAYVPSAQAPLMPSALHAQPETTSWEPSATRPAPTNGLETKQDNSADNVL
jgi:hypothetical protein